MQEAVKPSALSSVCIGNTSYGENHMTLSSQQKSLRRSRNDHIIAGVCGGLAEFFGVRVFWFRLAFLIALIPGGVPGLCIYLLLWLILPKADA